MNIHIKKHYNICVYRIKYDQRLFFNIHFRGGLTFENQTRTFIDTYFTNITFRYFFNLL